MASGSPSWFDGSFAIVDVESDGQRPPAPIEVAVIPIDGGKLGARREWLIKPPGRINAIVSRIHGIQDDDVIDAPTFGEVREEILAELDARFLVAHNARVDWNLLRRPLPDWKPPGVLDTLRLSRALLTRPGSHALSALVDELGISVRPGAGGRPHRAGYDAEAAAKLFVALVGLRGVPIGMARLRKLAQIWPALDGGALDEDRQGSLF